MHNCGASFFIGWDLVGIKLCFVGKNLYINKIN